MLSFLMLHRCTRHPDLFILFEVGLFIGTGVLAGHWDLELSVYKPRYRKFDARTKLTKVVKWEPEGYPLDLFFDACPKEHYGMPQTKDCGGYGQEKSLCQAGGPIYFLVESESTRPPSQKAIALINASCHDCQQGNCVPVKYHLRDPWDPKWLKGYWLQVRIIPSRTSYWKGPYCTMLIKKGWTTISTPSSVEDGPSLKLLKNFRTSQTNYTGIDMVQTINSTHRLLLAADPRLASDCWICAPLSQISYQALGITVNNMMARNPTSGVSTLLIEEPTEAIGNSTCLLGNKLHLNATCKCASITVYRGNVSAPEGTFFLCGDGVYRVFSSQNPWTLCFRNFNSQVVSLHPN
ncbi:endogenous retrovirus group S71 member 1 Env polyprotein-like [Heterocephalus glaber]|uniref:Endogenous retrovirus group S71 member 1 Env polyprotein-like n=1 Tax=Heterocephalus glaber TaxID=10181 RepID=A0AAX6TCL3_HETGA|nr:endogenous retrovirus group S71 member 1 Env polyprotein-like [Heterocephalus glaber]